MTNDSVSDIDKLRFYREEVRHEFSLVTARITILVTCQSFLVVPFAILNTAPRFREVLVAIYFVGGLGTLVALLLLRPIRAGHRAMDAWLLKQRTLIRTSDKLRDLAIGRDLIPGGESDPSLDHDHHRSLAFSRYGPWVFCAFWVAALLWATCRAVLGP